MDRTKIEQEIDKFWKNKEVFSQSQLSYITGLCEHIAVLSRQQTLEEAEESIYLLEKDMKCVNAIRTLKDKEL